MTQYNYISMTIIDATVWLAAALFIRYYETMLFSAPDQNLAILYAVTVPVSYVSVLIAQKLANLTAQTLCTGLCVGTAAALLMDGLALVWAPHIYSMTMTPVPYGSAWLLWGVCWLLASAVFSSRRQMSAA
jgi:hypothetical protein